jgi:hypothetical protein
LSLNTIDLISFEKHFSSVVDGIVLEFQNPKMQPIPLLLQLLFLPFFLVEASGNIFGFEFGDDPTHSSLNSQANEVGFTTSPEQFISGLI